MERWERTTVVCARLGVVSIEGSRAARMKVVLLQTIERSVGDVPRNLFGSVATFANLGVD